MNGAIKKNGLSRLFATTTTVVGGLLTSNMVVIRNKQNRGQLNTLRASLRLT